MTARQKFHTQATGEMKALSLAIIAVIECAKAAGVDIERVIDILRSEADI